MASGPEGNIAGGVILGLLESGEALFSPLFLRYHFTLSGKAFRDAIAPVAARYFFIED
jgi:hypothetical protein